MNPHQNSPSNPRNTNPNSQSSNTQFSYPFPHPSYPYVQNPNIDYPQPPNSQSSNTQFSYPFPHPSYLYPNIDNSQPPNTQFPFPNPFTPYAPNSQFQYAPTFQTVPSHFRSQQTPTENQNSPHSQTSAFDAANIIDPNEDINDVDDTQGGATQWNWSEDKVLISAWLNVSIDPMVGTDKKSEAFWDRIRNYCEESNPGLIKRGTVAIKKRWQRINEGAQRYGSCYEQAEQRAGSGSNMDNIIEVAHEIHKAKYNKKSNFDRHWNELRRQPKWRTPSTSSGSAKRTKLSDSGTYSSSMNEAPIDDNVVESPVRPKGTKAVKRKGKANAKSNVAAEYEELKATTCRRLDLMAHFNELKEKEVSLREKETDMQLLMLDTSTMNEAQREIHAKMIEEVKARRI
ncbi:hypothetical protein QQ045_029354 [Rhodiola kirilowii]